MLQLERLQLIDEQIARLKGMIVQALKPHQEAVARLAEVPGLGVDSAQQIISEVGVRGLEKVIVAAVDERHLD